MVNREQQFILWNNKTVPVRAWVKSGGVPCYAVQDDHGIALIPVAVAIEAPQRSRPVLVVDNT